MTNEKYTEINKERLNELEKQTNDKFTKKLIGDLKKQIDSNEPELFKHLSFKRIIVLIEHENKSNRLKEVKNNNCKNIDYGLTVSLNGKKRKLLLNGEFLLSEVSEMIQKEFRLEPGHLYEFNLGEYKFGPECDEWQEIFDSLDDFKLGSAISVANIKNKGKFNFLYDFGDRILFNIEVTDIKELNLGIKNG